MSDNSTLTEIGQDIISQYAPEYMSFFMTNIYIADAIV